VIDCPRALLFFGRHLIDLFYRALDYEPVVFSPVPFIITLNASLYSLLSYRQAGFQPPYVLSL